MGRQKHHNPFEGMFDDADSLDEEEMRQGGSILDDPEDDYEGDGYAIRVSEVTQVREKAIEVELDATMDLVWIPRSQIHDDSEVYDEGHSGRLVVTQWFAEQKGWSD